MWVDGIGTNSRCSLSRSTTFKLSCNSEGSFQRRKDRMGRDDNRVENGEWMQVIGLQTGEKTVKVPGDTITRNRAIDTAKSTTDVDDLREYQLRHPMCSRATSEGCTRSAFSIL